jgi:hypothetical protein
MNNTKSSRNKTSILIRLGTIVIMIAATASLLYLASDKQANASGNMALPPPVSDSVDEWNQIALARVLASGLPAPRQLRAMAIVEVSVHDAVNGLTGKYETYLPSPDSPENASLDGAAISAAYTALSGLLPSSTLTPLYLDSLAARQIATDDPGVVYGSNAANAILGLRADDGNSQAACAYIDRAPDPGVWQRVINPATNTFPPAALPCFGNVTPWVLKSNTQFAIDPPSALDSEQYTKDFNEVKSLGAKNSTTRTAEQTQIANFWQGSPADIWNQVMRQASSGQALDLSAKARAYALVYITGTDTSIACWTMKYLYMNWRPVTAINRADEDGNPDTEPHAGWMPFVAQHLHQHPDYPSGHATNSGALGAELGLIFGDSPGFTISPTITGITRQWDSFDQGIDEVIDARVYSGIHFRTSDVNGARLGRQIAQYVFTHALRPCKGKRGNCA